MHKETKQKRTQKAREIILPKFLECGKMFDSNNLYLLILRKG